LGMDLAGSPKTVQGITRKDLLHYRDAYYHPKNLTVVACGAVYHNALVQKIKRHFLHVRGKRPSRFLKAKQFLPRIAGRFVFKETAQTHLALGLPGLRREHPDQRKLGLLNVVLGANMSSRLFQEVRENRGLAYEISSHLRRFADTGALIIGAGVDSKRAHESIRVILNELTRLKSELVGKEEFQRAKEYYTGQLLMSLEDTLDHMVWLGESFVTLGRVVTPQEILEKVKRVQVNDVRKMARQVFQNRFVKLAVIGPQKRRDQKRIQEVIRKCTL